jgi:hypothetical protein
LCIDIEEVLMHEPHAMMMVIPPQGAERPRGVHPPSKPNTSWLGFMVFVGPLSQLQVSAFLEYFWQGAVARDIDMGEQTPDSLFLGWPPETEEEKEVGCFSFLVAVDWMLYNSLLVSSEEEIKEMLTQSGLLPALDAAATEALAKSIISLN